MRALILLRCSLSLAALLLTGSAVAAPWVDPGNLALRNDIQLLADAGIIPVPVTTWPLSWGDLAAGLGAASPVDPASRLALARVQRALKMAKEVGRYNLSFATSLASEPRQLRTFAETPRESAEVRAGMDWTGLRFSYRLQGTLVSSADDDRTFRADGSYLGVVLGNYMLSLGQLERWWGPGRDGSLILSTNARPVPGLAVRRNFSSPPKSRWLRWIGPWTASLLWGQLESGRAVPDARLFALRVNFRPTHNLEIGLSRTAQWCGNGRPCDAGTFADLLLGKDNRGENADLATEPGNQLAGVDWRWRLPLPMQLAWYGQFIGEDEAGGLPSRMIGQLGLEAWGYSQRVGGIWRGHLEFADTAAEFYKDQVRYDYAYEHFIYDDGYRYRGRSIGHAMDNDGRMISAGITIDMDSGDHWYGLLRIVDLNRGGVEANTRAQSSLDVVNLELGYNRVMQGGRLDLGVGVDRTDNWMTTDPETDLRGHVSWQGRF